MMMGMSRIVHILCIVLFLYLFISLVEADALSQETDALKEQASSLLSVYTLPIITLTFIIGLQQAFWGQKTLVPTLFTVGFVLMAGTIFILTDCLFHAHGYYADWVLYVSTLIAVVAGCVGGLVSVCWIAWGAFQYGALLGAIIGLSIYSAFLSNIIPPDHPDLWLDATVLACLFLWGFLCVYYHTSMLLLTACLFGSYLMVRSALTAIGFTWPAPPNMQLLTTSSSSSSSTTTSITSKSLSTSDYLLLYISLGIIVIIALIGLWFQMSQPDRLPMHQRGPHSHIDYYTLNPKPGSGKMAQRRLNGGGGGVEHSNGHVIHSSTTYV